MNSRDKTSIHYDHALDLREKGMEVEDGWWIVYTSGLKYHIRHEHKEKKWLFLAIRGVRASNSGDRWKVWRCELCQAQVPDALLGMLRMARCSEKEL